MVIEFETVRIQKFKNELCWEIYLLRPFDGAKKRRGDQKYKDGELRWVHSGKYPSTLECAVQHAYEYLLKESDDVLPLEAAMAEAKRLQRGLIKAVQDATKSQV